MTKDKDKDDKRERDRLKKERQKVNKRKGWPPYAQDPAHIQAQAGISAQAQTLTQDPAHNQAQAETKPKLKRRVSFTDTVDLSNEVHLQIACFLPNIYILC